jgi:hypothetical protein
MIDNVKCKVIGKNTSSEGVYFKLGPEEIRHIRRCASHYLQIHPVDGSGITKTIISKFRLFGMKSKSRRKSEVTKKFKELTPDRACSNCGSTQCLTRDHIQELSDGGKDTIENSRWLCQRCHTARNLQKRIYWKQKEIEVLSTMLASHGFNMEEKI